MGARTFAILAAAVMAGAPVAAVAQDKAVRPPASLDAKGIDDWRKAHIAAEGWALVFADAAAISYAGGGNGVKADSDGFLRVDVRREYYKSVRLGSQPSRSNVQTWIVDCGLQRFKIVAMSFWRLNNMKGDGFRKTAEDATWTTAAPNSDNSHVIDLICAAQPAAR